MRIGLFVVLLAGCDPLANDDYVGEPLFTLEGTLVAAAATDSDNPGGLALLWQDSVRAGGPGVAVTAVPVEIEFPSTFRVSVPLPPPEEARFRFDDAAVELAEAYVFVVADADARPIPRGADRTHALVYATADVEDGTLAAAYLGGPVSAGYHLRRYARVEQPEPAQAALVERCVANGALRAACATRRGYRLEAIADDARLRIAVTP